ncbi:NfeD family protein [Gilvimarinus agarilyticus]|uniref:NfeD family protein n=1 Tax=unclassified Gilvimarinus TaxID=2642066 RepID=UPI001C08E2AF|nr:MULTISPECIES: NfeD family protein [unclassified Gilvimarinus]MBU2887533.1 NfeD family protein [Gilvimarinus agarilyticus]MDO6572184.1 NfeD family protein [Gilvimarinus sp. 2_MG-2023]MDO6746748.1 NfeD family protein [Gilvimarinus sp. 1_MG-2023]
MEDWVSSGLPAWAWVVAGFALAALEIILPSFFMLWLGVSAIVVGVLSLFLPFDLAAQLFLWAVLSMSCLVAWFRWVAPRMKDKTRSGMAYEKLLGQTAIVLVFNASTGRGQLRFSAPILGEDEWRFICSDDLSAGDRVVVKDVSGNDLVVTLHQ